MRKIWILGAFVAVLAFSAMAVASASATLWLKNGESLTKEEATSIDGLLLLVNESSSGKVEIHCTGAFHGSVGPGAEDLISEILGLSGEKNKVTCETTKGITLAGKCETGKLVLVEAINLSIPWHTLLLLHTDGTTWDMIELGSGATAKPGYSIFCEGIVGTVTCKSDVTEAKFGGNLTNGALFEFKGEEGALSEECSFGKGKLFGMGEVLNYTVS